MLFRPTLIFDTETVGEDFETVDETTQEVLTRWIKRETESSEDYAAALADLKNGMDLCLIPLEATFISE